MTKRCANCKYYKPLTMMKKEERIEFLNICKQLNIENPEDHGYCMKFEDDVSIVSKDDGVHCKYWVVKGQIKSNGWVVSI